MDARRRRPRQFVVLAGLLSACTGQISEPGSGPSHPGTHGGSGGTGGGSSSGGSSGTGGSPGTSGSSGGSGTSGNSGNSGSPGSGGAGGTSAPTVFSRTGLAARLGKFEYRNSIADVLGVTLSAAELDGGAAGIPDDNGDGVFKHIADRQTSIEQQPLAYFQVADAVAKRVDIAALSTRLGSCTKQTTDCATAFVKAAGRLLYRRPLEQREVDAVLVVYTAAVAEKLAFVDAARWTLRALLQTPQFLFRMDKETVGTPDQPRDLNGYELAEELASFLWVSVPDDALLTVAADDSLMKPDVLDAQVKRMLADQKAQRFTEVFATDFSRARFASFDGATDEDRAAMNESVVATFQDHFWTQKGSISDLFTTTRFVVNPIVAKVLGVSMTGTGLQAVDVSTQPQRVGLLSHPGMIAGMGDRATGSFINRGKYLMERLLCRNPIDVPAALGAEIENFNATTTGLNELERSALRQMRTQCWSCHKQFEPLSFGFARFDGAGRYVGDKDADGKALPLDGWVPTGEAQEPRYTDVASFMRVLATNPVIQSCMTEHFIAFATSRSTDALAKAQAGTVGQQYQSSGSTLAAMVSAVVKSPLFRTVLTSPSSSSPPQTGVQP